MKRFRCRRILLVVGILCLYGPAQTQKAGELPVPGQNGTVLCVSDATQSYALYLPSSYTPAKRWPIIYLFDPAGRGQRPIDLYKDIAETYGFILAGSRNSRNFSNEESKAVKAIWEDTHERLSLDEHRAYTSGFSGGARVAGAMALSSPEQIAGVIAHGAGYPSSKAGLKDDLPYFFAIGNEDFNWPEVVNIRRERESQGSPYRVRVYPGKHQWAPAAVMEEAIQYLNIRAMQAGFLARDPASSIVHLRNSQPMLLTPRIEKIPLPSSTHIELWHPILTACEMSKNSQQNSHPCSSPQHCDLR